MDTNDAWIRKRTGISQRHYCPEGVGVSDLALPAAQQALEAAGRGAEDVDYVLFNTMTPDHVFPGSGTATGRQAGLQGCSCARPQNAVRGDDLQPSGRR
jgi:3-oxoacyl-[acyl-carrier-protein] synthase-3